jgi:hypothetical protein
MHAFWLNVSVYGLTWLASAGIVAAGALVACLSHVAQSTRGHVGRVGLQPVRIEVPPSRTPTVLSVRTLDATHVWIRSTGANALVQSDASA